MQNPPDFSQQLDPKSFQIQGAAGYKQALQDSSAAIGNINNDWTETNAALGQEQQGLAKTDQLASGQGLTAGAETRFNQEDLGANNGSTQSLGQALMRMGSKASTQQNVQASQAQSQQQMQALQEATQMRLQMAQQQRDMFKANLQLSNQKFAMQRAAQQTQDGLDLAQVHLTNMFNQAIAGAKNAQDLAQIQTNQMNFGQTMQYLRLGAGAASAAAAGAAAIVSGAAKRDDSSDGSIDLQQQGPNRYGGLTTSTNYGYQKPIDNPQPGVGPNSLPQQQAFWGVPSPTLTGRGAMP